MHAFYQEADHARVDHARSSKDAPLWAFALARAARASFAAADGGRHRAGHDRRHAAGVFEIEGRVDAGDLGDGDGRPVKRIADTSRDQRVALSWRHKTPCAGHFGSHAARV